MPKKNSNPTQCDRIADYLCEHGSITQYDAFFELGIMRLASRISEMRKNGWRFKVEMVEVRNKYKEICRVERYTPV